jgi:plastocyanin
MKRSLITAAGITLLLAACSNNTTTSTTPSSPSGSTETEAITIQMTEFDFLMPDTIPAGVQTMHLENIGGMPHFVEFAEIKGGKTNDDIQALLDDPEKIQGPPPSWISEASMPSIGLLSPGASTDVTIDLPPGTYAAFCWMPDAEGTEHALLGMHHVFTVEGEQSGTLPTADFTLTWNGSTLEGVPSTIEPGTTATIAYENTGPKAADISSAQILLDIPTDKLNKAVDSWFGGLYAGPAPVQFLGGLFGLEPGAGIAGTTTITFTDGVYGFGGPGKSEPILVTVGAGGYPTPSASMDDMSCTPDGTELSVTASQVQFDTHCLAAPAGEAFTIAFDNQDPGTAHNVAISSAKEGSDPLFSGEIVTGPSTTTYDVGALEAGTYRFECQVHPTTMNGTFIVG